MQGHKEKLTAFPSIAVAVATAIGVEPWHPPFDAANWVSVSPCMCVSSVGGGGACGPLLCHSLSVFSHFAGPTY